VHVYVCVGSVHDDSSSSPHVIHKQTLGLARRPDICSPY